MRWGWRVETGGGGDVNDAIRDALISHVPAPINLRHVCLHSRKIVLSLNDLKLK